jgi:hypothetical protein
VFVSPNLTKKLITKDINSRVKMSFSFNGAQCMQLLEHWGTVSTIFFPKDTEVEDRISMFQLGKIFLDLVVLLFSEVDNTQVARDQQAGEIEDVAVKYVHRWVELLGEDDNYPYKHQVVVHVPEMVRLFGALANWSGAAVELQNKVRKELFKFQSNFRQKPAETKDKRGRPQGKDVVAGVRNCAFVRRSPHLDPSPQSARCQESAHDTERHARC